MGTRLSTSGPQEKLFAAFMDGLAQAAEHEDRHTPMRRVFEYAGTHFEDLNKAMSVERCEDSWRPSIRRSPTANAVTSPAEGRTGWTIPEIGNIPRTYVACPGDRAAARVAMSLLRAGGASTEKLQTDAPELRPIRDTRIRRAQRRASDPKDIPASPAPHDDP